MKESKKLHLELYTNHISTKKVKKNKIKYFVRKYAKTLRFRHLHFSNCERCHMWVRKGEKYIFEPKMIFSFKKIKLNLLNFLTKRCLKPEMAKFGQILTKNGHLCNSPILQGIGFMQKKLGNANMEFLREI